MYTIYTISRHKAVCVSGFIYSLVMDDSYTIMFTHSEIQCRYLEPAAHYFILPSPFMIRAVLIIYPIIPDTEATVAPTAFLHIKKMQLKLREAKKKQHSHRKNQ